MRVLHLVTRFLSAGSERNMLASMRWEREQGHEVHLAVGGESDEAVGGESDERGVPDDIEVHRLPSLVRAISPRADLRARQEVCDLLTSTPFDVLHTHQSKAGVVGRIAGRGRVPVTVHTVHTASFGPGSSMLASVAFPTAERVCARFTNLIVCVGEELREMYLDASIGQPRQFRVLRSPIDVDRFATGRHVTLDDRAALRARFGVRDGARMLLSIGALEPRKRHALLVQRLAPLLRSGQADLVIAGDGPERPRLQQLAAEAGCADAVHLLGFVEDVPAVLAASDALVHASAAEGVPQVVIQALAAGAPVLATDVVGLREVPDAPVTIVRANGDGLLDAARGFVSAPRPQPVPLAALDAWRPSSVHDELARLHADVASLRSTSGATRRLSVEW